MSESAEQSALFAWASQVSFSYPALRLLYAIPNGGARNKITAAILKREGVRAGVPDICLPVPSGAYHALYIELKRTAQPGKPRGTLSEAQKWWIGELQAVGNFAMVCYGWDEARRTIEAYLRGSDG